MTENEALEAIGAALEKTLNKKLPVELHANLISDGVIDSLDSMVFLMDLSSRTGKEIADEDANNPAFFQVSRLVAFLRSE